MGAHISQSDRSSGQNRPTSGNRFSTSQAFTPEIEHVVVHKDKKKKHSKLATIKKKLSRSKRHSKSLDYSRAMRDLLSGWNSVRDVHTLVADYEATLALKELTYQANLSRPRISSYKEDLGALYDCKYFTDVDLIYKNTVFPVHRAILALRCPFFRDLLARYPHYGAHVPVAMRTPGVSVGVFSSLLRYLYTGQFHSQDNLDNNLNLLIQLADEFGTPNPLENDLKTLLETGVYSDAILVFTSSNESDTLHDPSTPDPIYEARHLHRHELKCHRAVLAARSPFFKNMLLRRERAAEQAINTPTCIVLDESVIPRRYARVLLNAIYLDTVDLSCIVRTSVSMCSLSEVQAMVSGKAHMTEADEAMEIYQIAQFLEFPVLAQGCENILCDKLCVDNIVSMLNWSAEPHGSTWIYRQAMTFLQEEFHAVINSPVLIELNKHYLLSAIKSDFLQASELEVLTAVLKWGEQQLIKRIEEREPNLLTHTTHSISRKGIKKRDLNDVELRDILADLLPYVRVDHVLPRSHETLTSSMRRGLISQPPTHMLGDDSSHTNSSAAWVRGRFSGVYCKPRAFMPYYEEAKFILEENISQLEESDNVRLRMVHISGIPDALYMVHDHGSAPNVLYGGGSYNVHSRASMLDTSSVDIIAGTIPVPNQDTLESMIKREAELLCSKAAQRALNLPAINKRAITYQIQLRVVREFALPDSSAEILHNSKQYQQVDQHLLEEARYHTPRRRHRPIPGAWNDHHAHSSNSTPMRSYSSIQSANLLLSPDRPALCEAIPDIAMPTSLPSLRQLCLNDDTAAATGYTPTYPSTSSFYPRTEPRHFTPTEPPPPPPPEPGLDLDLGDGASHSGSRGSTFERRPRGNSLYI